MLKNFSKILKEERGQIGQLLVVVVLIVLSVLGISKYIMPAFQSGNNLAGSSQGTLVELEKQTGADTLQFKPGDSVNGATLKNLIDNMKTKQTGIRILVKTQGFVDDYTGVSYEEKLAADSSIKTSGREINPYGTYLITNVSKKANGTLEGFEFQLSN
jgi:hypothetical protein